MENYDDLRFVSCLLCFPLLDLLIWFTLSCLISLSSVLFLCSIAYQSFRAHDFLLMRRRAGGVKMLPRYRSDVEFEIDDGIDDFNVVVDTNVAVF